MVIIPTFFNFKIFLKYEENKKKKLVKIIKLK